MTQTTTNTRRATTTAAPDGTRNYDWRDDANCATVDPELFFPNGRGGQIAQQTRQAKKVCRGCPVRVECLRWAVETGQTTGVWGGLSELERRPLTRVQEPSMTYCMNRQAWIEEQLEAGVGQKTIARELGVDPGVLSRAVRRFREERLASEMAVSA